MTGARRVDFLVAGLEPLGGAETQLIRVARGLRERGWDVRVITFFPRSPIADELEAAGIGFASLDAHAGAAHAPRAALRLWKLLRTRKPDVLVTFMFHADLLGRVAGRLAGLRVVVSSVRADNIGSEARYRALALTDGLAAVTTTNSSRVRDDLVRRGVVAPHRARVIANGIDVSRPAPPPERVRELREQLGAADGEFAWLAVGHLAVRKDYPTLLRALQRLEGRGGRWKVAIVGGGSLEGELHRQASELGLDGRVRWLGLRDNAAELAFAADGFVMSSTMEGTPNALIEALLAGVPAVATAVGGIPELLHENVSGYLASPGDDGALADAMERLMALPSAARAGMGRAGRAQVVKVHDLHEVVGEWERLLLELIGATAAGRGPR